MALTKVSYSMITGASVNVLDYGTDTAAFTAAIAKCIATKSSLYIPAGTYTASIIVPPLSHGLTIVGEDWESTIIEAVDGTQHGIELQANSFYVTIANLQIKNTLAANDGNHCGILSAGSGLGNGNSGLIINRVKVSGYNFNIKIDEFNNTHLETVWLTGAVVDGAVAKSGSSLYAGHPTIHCVGLYMRDLHIAAGEYGIYGETWEGCTMSDCEVLLSNKQGFIHQISGTGVIGMFLTNCYFDSTSLDALYLEGVNNGTFSNIWLSASTGTGRGLYLVDCSYNAFTNVQAFDNLGGGIFLLQNSQYNQFSNCVIRNNTGYGIQIANSNNPGNVFSTCNVTGNTTADILFSDATPANPNTLNQCVYATKTIQTKDITTPNQTITLPFTRLNLADGAFAGDLYYASGTEQTKYISPYSGSILSISLALNDTRIAGSLIARPLVDGIAQDGIRVVVDGTNTQYVTRAGSYGTASVVAGQSIGIYYDTDAAWDTAGAASSVDMVVTITFATQA